MKWDELKNRINQKQQKLTINLKDSEVGEELIYNIKKFHFFTACTNLIY